MNNSESAQKGDSQPEGSQPEKKEVILAKHSGHHADLLADDLLNEDCVSPKACFAAMDDWGNVISNQFKKWKDYPFAVVSEKSQDELWKEAIDVVLCDYPEYIIDSIDSLEITKDLKSKYIIQKRKP